MDTITQAFKQHHARMFEARGATPQGIGWRDEPTTQLRYDKMLAVIQPERTPNATDVQLLDVGCGYGGLYAYAASKGINLQYTGIDVCEDMVTYAQAQHPQARFLATDIFAFAPQTPFDYVVCNGILTQKLSTGIQAMDAYAHRLIEKMFSLATQGIAFNTMTTKVDYMEDHLYYRNPVELFAYCLAHLTRHIKLDHAYPLYEYTLYLYHA